jgi:hypothetical protein
MIRVPEESSANRWGFKIFLRPIYGEPNAFIKSKEMTNAKLLQIVNKIGGEETLRKWISTINNLVFLASRLTRTLMKGIDTNPEEIHLKECLSWYIFKGGIQTKQSIEQILDYSSEMNNKSDSKSEETQGTRYKLNKSTLDVEILSLYEEIYSEPSSVSNGRMNSLLNLVRKQISYPGLFLTEKRRPTFTNEIERKWNKTEKLSTLCLLYHSGCIQDLLEFVCSKMERENKEEDEKSEKKEKEKEKELSQKEAKLMEIVNMIGEYNNKMLMWMVDRVQSEREYQQVLRSIIEQIENYYEKFKEKRRKELREKREQEEKKKEETENLEKEKKEEEEKEEKEEEKKVKGEEEEEKTGRIIVKQKGKNRKKKIVKRMYHEVKKKTGKKSKKEKKMRMDKTEEKEEKKEREEEKLIESLSEIEQNDLKDKLHHEVYDNFLHQYQGNFQKVKDLCKLLSIPYDAKDPSEAIKQIFNKSKEALLPLISFHQNSTLSESISHTQISKLVQKSPYKIVANHVNQHILVLLNVETGCCEKKVDSKGERKSVEKSKSVKSKRGKVLEPLGIGRSISLQNYLQEAQGEGEDLQNAMETYIRLKRLQKPSNVQQHDLTKHDSSPFHAVFSFITSNYNVNAVQNSLVLQKRRGAYRRLAFLYQNQLVHLFKNTPFMRMLVGNLTEALSGNVFNNVQASGYQIQSLLSAQAKQLSTRIMKLLISECNFLKTINSLVKKRIQLKKDMQKNIKIVDENFIYEHMKHMIVVFSDMRILLHQNNIDLVGKQSASLRIIKAFLESIVKLTLMSQNYINVIHNTSAFARLNSYHTSSCQVILNRFLTCAYESKDAELKLEMQQILLQIFIDALERESGVRKKELGGKQVFDFATKPNYYNPIIIQRLAHLLSLIYEILLIVDNLEEINKDLLNRSCTILGFVLMNIEAPAVIRTASKCAQIVFKHITPDSLVIPSLSPLSTSQTSQFMNSKSDKKENAVLQFLKRIGQYVSIINPNSETISSSPTSSVEGEELYPSEEKSYVVYMHLNHEEEDLTFILNALYHWEEMHPTVLDPHQNQSLKEKERDSKVLPNGGKQMMNKKPGIYAKKALKPNALNSIIQLDKIMEETIKVSFEEVKETDNAEEVIRKEKERAFIKRIKKHFVDAKAIATILLSRSFASFLSPLSYSEGVELSSLLEKAYLKKVSPIPINPYIAESKKQNKLEGFNLLIKDSFPLIFKEAAKPKEQQYKGPKIEIAKPQLLLSLCESSISDKLEGYLNNGNSSSLHPLLKHKYNLEGVGLESLQKTFVSGASISLILNQLLNLLRILARTEQRVHTNDQDEENSWNSALISYVNQSLELVSTKKWNQISIQDKAVVFGALILTAGWSNAIKPGSLVQTFVNNNKVVCTVVAGGNAAGSNTISAIIQNDQTFTIHKIPLSQVKPYQDTSLSQTFNPNQTLMLTALRKTLLTQNLERYTNISDENSDIRSSIFSENFLLVLLLKVSSSIKWENLLREHNKL